MCAPMQEGWKGRRTFIVTCQHGTRTLDRNPEVRHYLSRHGQCNAAWEPYMQQPSETDAEHVERLKETFCFPRHGTAFTDYPTLLPTTTPKGKPS